MADHARHTGAAPASTMRHRIICVRRHLSARRSGTRAPSVGCLRRIWACPPVPASLLPAPGTRAWLAREGAGDKDVAIGGGADVIRHRIRSEAVGRGRPHRDNGRHRADVPVGVAGGETVGREPPSRVAGVPLKSTPAGALSSMSGQWLMWNTNANFVPFSPGVQVHRPARPPEAPGPARDGEGAVLRVVERTFDDDLAAWQEGRPVALVRRPGHHADAVALVGADAAGVGAVEDLVGEGQHVSCAVALRARVGGRVRRRVLDDGERLWRRLRGGPGCRPMPRPRRRAPRARRWRTRSRAGASWPLLLWGRLLPRSRRYRRVEPSGKPFQTRRISSSPPPGSVGPDVSPADQPTRSPWLAQLADDGPLQPLEADTSADVAVVGAGIAGVATAFFILRGTSHSVLLIERDRVARGATGRNAGQLDDVLRAPAVRHRGRVRRRAGRRGTARVSTELTICSTSWSPRRAPRSGSSDSPVTWGCSICTTCRSTCATASSAARAGGARRRAWCRRGGVPRRASG